MKTYKIISVFFLTIILSSCSKDDEASKSFFNKYDGIAWELDDADNGIIFNKSPKSASFFYYDYDLEDIQCDIYSVFGVEEEDGFIMNILEENEDSVIFEQTFTNFEGSIETYYFTFRVINSGATLEGTTSTPNEDDEVFTYTRLSINPCN